MNDMARKYYYYLSLSTLTWFATNVLGASLIAANNLFGLRFGDVLVISMLFSIPSVFGLIASCFHLTTIRNRKKRITWAVLSNAVIVVLIAACFLILAWRFNDLKYALRHYPSTPADFFLLLFPFAISAPVCFLLIANKLVFTQRMNFTLRNPNSRFIDHSH
jgi:hypothetical protein